MLGLLIWHQLFRSNILCGTCFTKNLRRTYATTADNKLNIIPTVLVHGGCCADASENLIFVLKNGVKLAARFGYEELLETGDVLKAVRTAVCKLEENPSFNAGYGSALALDGTIEMDAALMRGCDLKAGCVSLVRNICSPITLAQVVLEKTKHVYIAGESAMKLAWENDFEQLKDDALVTVRAMDELKQYKEQMKEKNEKSKCNSTGTVGAVAIDQFGNVAAATSTGGICGKLPGRIGDSPILGGGTYADNDIGCISLTGNGERIMRFNLASRIMARMQYLKCTPHDAAEGILKEMNARLKHVIAGAIIIDKNGQLGISFTGQRMPWAYKRGKELHVGLDKGEDEVELLKR